jgi:protein phosphatase-4 regulatory subunit 3
VEQHYKDFEDVTYVKTFKNLKQRYEQQQDRLKDKQPSLDKQVSKHFFSLCLDLLKCVNSMPAILRGGAGPGSRFRRDPRSLDEDEEMYFDQEDDFEEADGAADAIAMSISSDLLKKNKLDSDFDQISRFLERKSPSECFEI